MTWFGSRGWSVAADVRTVPFERRLLTAAVAAAAEISSRVARSDLVHWEVVVSDG